MSKLPTINSVITKGTNDYPSFSKMGNEPGIKYEVQPANIQNQPLPNTPVYIQNQPTTNIQNQPLINNQNINIIPNQPLPKGTNEYPNFNQSSLQGREGDIRYDVQGSKIQNQPIPKGMGNSSINDSQNPMYDVDYSSESAKNYNQPIQNVPLQQQNVDMSSVSVSQSDILDQQYCSDKTKGFTQTNQYPKNAYDKKYNKGLDTEYNSSPLVNDQFGQPIPPRYGPGLPNGPRMNPHFPHFPHHPHFPHGYSSQPYPGNYYPYA